MIPDDATLLAAFPAAPGELHLRALLKQLKVGHDERPALRARIRALVDAGKLERLRGNRYTRPQGRASAGAGVGTLSVHPRGFGFVQPDGGGEGVYLDPRALRHAMHRDRVRFRLEPGSEGRSQGVITEVVERGTHSLVGTLRLVRGRRAVHPQDPRLPDALPVEPGPGSDGALVAVELLRFPGDPEGPLARVVRVFDQAGAVGADTDQVVFDLGLRMAFEPEALAEAAAVPSALPAAELARRVDLRDRPLVTIDPESAQDFDDAVHACPIEAGGWRLTVAIADVAHYVPEDSALDQEARARGTSVYLPDRVLPMLPERISNDLCSLRPGEDRLTLAVEIEIAPDGALGAGRIFEAVIRSHARLSYAQVGRALGIRGPEDVPQEEPALEPLRPVLEALLAATRARRRFRQRRGYLALEISEPRIWFDAEGKVSDVRAAPRHEAHLLVEDAMLVANEYVAEWFVERELPSIFRIHDRPPHTALGRLRGQTASLAAPLQIEGRLSPAQLNRYLAAQADHPLVELLHLLLLRSMAKAAYAAEVAPHFGLGAERYLHFTSPIRRYPDLLVHRLWKRAMAETPEEDLEVLDALAEHCSRRERVALEAQRAVLDLYKARFLADHLHARFTGTVVSVVPQGVFVQLDAHAVEGLLLAERILDDNYRFDRESGELVGRARKGRIGLGARFEIEVRRVDVLQRQVDFDCVRRVGRRGDPLRPGGRRG